MFRSVPSSLAAEQPRDQARRFGDRHAGDSDRGASAPALRLSVPHRELGELALERRAGVILGRIVSGKAHGTCVALRITRVLRRVLGIVLQHRTGARFEKSEQPPQHPALELRIVRHAERPAEHERDPQCARRPYRRGLLADEAHLRRRYAGALEVVSECAHGARAVRSDR